MYVIIVKRITKVPTFAKGQYDPRTTNKTTLHVCGPFGTRKAAERAVLAVLSSNTCLDAQTWSEDQIVTEWEKGSVRHRDEVFAVLTEAKRMIDGSRTQSPT